jgi:hypothetical protein
LTAFYLHQSHMNIDFSVFDNLHLLGERATHPSRLLSGALARIFHRGDAHRAQQRDAWVRGMTPQGLDAPARQAVRPSARCWDAMGVECFCPIQIGFAMKPGFSL